MATDMFIKFSNKIDGESIDRPKEVDVISWSWGMTQSGSMHVSTGGGAGKVSVQDISFVHYIDSASGTLMQKCCDGTHIDTADITVRKAGGAAPVEYLKIHLFKVIISAITTGGAGGGDRITETVHLNFQKFKVEYTPQEGSGMGGATSPVEWHIARNKATLKDEG